LKNVIVFCKVRCGSSSTIYYSNNLESEKNKGTAISIRDEFHHLFVDEFSFQFTLRNHNTMLIFDCFINAIHVEVFGLRFINKSFASSVPLQAG
jgi:hypothetical protein